MLINENRVKNFLNTCDKLDIYDLKYFIEEKFPANINPENIFYNLLFVLLIPQCKYLVIVTIVEEFKKLRCFENRLNFSQIDIKNLISKVRFNDRKSKFLLNMFQNFSSVYSKFKTNYEYSDIELRAFFCNQFKGLGLKTSSHLLRNIGARSLSIIDRHILKYMCVDKPITNKKYVEIENDFKIDANIANLSVAEYDLLIWKKYANYEWSSIIY